MAPMTTWSADPDGAISDAELDYYRRRVQGVGMVVTGCTHVTENGIDWGDLMSAGLMASLPTLAVAGYVQRYLLRGFAGGLK